MMASPFLASRAPTSNGESVFWMVAVSPILAASAWAISMSKPIAWLLVSIDSCGGEGVSGRKVTGPGRPRVGGGGVVGGLGLAMTGAQGGAFATPRPGRGQPPPARAREGRKA